MTEKTPNVELPLGKGSDIFSLFDINSINTKLDLLIKALQDKDLLHDEEITAIKSNNNTVTNTLQAHGDSIMAHSTTINTLLNDVADTTNNFSDLLDDHIRLSETVHNIGSINKGFAMDMSAINGQNYVNVSSGVKTSVAQITLTPGTWVLIATVGFNVNANGFRELLLTSAANATAGAALGRTNAISGGNTIINGASIIDNDSEEDIVRYLTVNQTSGSSINVTPMSFVSIKIA